MEKAKLIWKILLERDSWSKHFALISSVNDNTKFIDLYFQTNFLELWLYTKYFQRLLSYCHRKVIDVKSVIKATFI